MNSIETKVADLEYEVLVLKVELQNLKSFMESKWEDFVKQSNSKNEPEKKVVEKLTSEMFVKER